MKLVHRYVCLICSRKATFTLSSFSLQSKYWQKHWQRHLSDRKNFQERAGICQGELEGHLVYSFHFNILSSADSRMFSVRVLHCAHQAAKSVAGWQVSFANLLAFSVSFELSKLICYSLLFLTRLFQRFSFWMWLSFFRRSSFSDYGVLCRRTAESFEFAAFERRIF